MKKKINKYLKLAVIILFVTSAGIFASCCLKKVEPPSNSYESIRPANLLVTTAGKPTKTILDLLAVLNLEHNGTLQNIVEVTQKHLLRPAGKERWQTPESLYSEKHEKIIPLLEQLGFFKKIQAGKKSYRYGVLLGATVTNVRKRLAFLIDEWNGGVRVDELIVLAGQRPLDQELEREAVLYDRTNNILPIKQLWQEPKNQPKTETEMIKMLFKQAQFPEGLAKVPCTFVDALAQKNSNGSIRRPTTGDTVNAWLAQNPKPGNCLVISCQPYVAYQDSVLRSLMPALFFLETIGSEVDKEEDLATLLDTVARTLYQELQRFKISAKTT